MFRLQCNRPGHNMQVFSGHVEPSAIDIPHGKRNGRMWPGLLDDEPAPLDR